MLEPDDPARMIYDLVPPDHELFSPEVFPLSPLTLSLSPFGPRSSALTSANVLPTVVCIEKTSDQM